MKNVVGRAVEPSHTITFTVQMARHLIVQLQKKSLDCIQRKCITLTSKRIETGTPEGDALGFYEDLFSGWLETMDDNRLYLHYIISRNRNEGNTQALLRQWITDGYDLRVVMPRPVMQHILKKYQFIPYREYFPHEYEDEVEVWCRTGVWFPCDTEIPQAGPS